MVVPFLTLPRETQLLIYSRMNTRDLYRIASTCKDAFMFTYENKKTLSSRLQGGEMCALTTMYYDTLGFGVDLNWRTLEVDFEVEEDFHDKVALLSMHQLDIRIEDPDLFPEALELLKTWNPLCLYAYFDHTSIPFSNILDFIEHIRAKTFSLHMNHALFTEIKDRMLQSDKREAFYLSLNGDEWNHDNIYENMKHFGGFDVSLRTEYIDKFFSDLIAHRDNGNLTRFTMHFSLFYGPYEFHEILSPYAKLLFVNYEVNDRHEKSISWTIQKLPLKNNLCAIVERRNGSYKPPTGWIKVDIIKDDEEQILDFLLTKKLKISEKIFTKEKRRRYLEMEDSDRLDELKMHYAVI